MKSIFIIFLFIYMTDTNANLLHMLHDNILSLLDKRNGSQVKPGISSGRRYFAPPSHLANGKKYKQTPQKGHRFENDLSDGHEELPKLTVSLGISNEDIEKKALNISNYRRFTREDLNKNWIHSRSIGITSSSADEKAWKTEFKFRWRSRKKDALLDPLVNQTRGHVVNMAAARPWRVPCGEDETHNLYTGSCTLPYECPPEFRVFRGDYHCGRNSFVCCRILQVENDLYEAFDPTIVETSHFSTSSEEKRKKKRGSKEIKKRKRQRKRNRTLTARYRRKRFIKKTIRKLAKEVRKELNRAFRNSTENRRHIIRNLKVLIKKLKTNFREERHLAKFQQDLDLANINVHLQEKLQKIRGLNYNFLTNDTFRSIIINGTATRQGAEHLFEAYPELNSDYTELVDLVQKTRRSGGDQEVKHKNKRQPKKKKKYIEYDVEFGMLA